MISPDDEIRRQPEIAARPTAKGIILARLRDGECFEINRVGAALWAAIETPRRFSDVCDELATRFGVEAAVVESDLQSLLEALSRADLIFATPRR
jgi:hypothetical protein